MKDDEFLTVKTKNKIENAKSLIEQEKIPLMSSWDILQQFFIK